MWICANDERIRYTGRIDCRVEAEPGLGVSGVFGGVLVFRGGAEDSCGEF